MHKLRKAAVVTAVLAGVGLLGAGTAHAGGGSDSVTYEYTQSSPVEPQQQWSGGHHRHKPHVHKVEIRQFTSCKSREANVDILGNVGVLNGAFANAGGGKGSPGVQSTKVGSSAGCNNIIRR